MFDQPKERQLEELLDTLLFEYSAVSPRPGLEARILSGLRARADRRRRKWSLAVGLTVAAAVLVVGLAIDRHPKPASNESAKVVAVVPVLRDRKANTPTSSSSTMRSSARVGNRDRAKPPNLIQVADAMRGEGRLIFEQEKLYLAPAPEPEPATAAQQETVTPTISIQELGVKPIAIKELSSEKETDKEGRL